MNFCQLLGERIVSPLHLGNGIGGWAKPNPLFDDGDRSSNESGDDEFVGVEDQDDFHGYAGKNVIHITCLNKLSISWTNFVDNICDSAKFLHLAVQCRSIRLRTQAPPTT